MPTARSRPANIDAYIAAFPPDVQAVLQQVRRAVSEAAPDAGEAISYGIPAFRQRGVLVYFAAFRKHIGFYPPVRGDAALEKAASRYAGEKGNLQFPLDQPLPLALIRRLTRLRARQDAGSAAKSGAAGSKRTPKAAKTAAKKTARKTAKQTAAKARSKP